MSSANCCCTCAPHWLTEPTGRRREAGAGSASGAGGTRDARCAPGAAPLPPSRLRLQPGWMGRNCADADVWLEPGKVHLVGSCCGGVPRPDSERTEGSGEDNRSSETGLANFIPQLSAAAASFSHRCCLRAFYSPSLPPFPPVICEINVDILIGGLEKNACPVVILFHSLNGFWSCFVL